jgi:hypothetical protein
MDADKLKQSWQAQSSQTRLLIDAELLLQELRRNDQNFAAMIFWRDFREVGVALLLLPVWIYLGIKDALPWSWYLAVPAMLWVAGYMLVDRMRHKRQLPQPGESLRQHVESSMAQIEHQIWLLRNVFWWYLLPLAVALLAFFAQVTWRARSGGWTTALGLFVVVAFASLVFAGIYWLNQHAVRADLEPRRLELERLLLSLKDETTDAT